MRDHAYSSAMQLCAHPMCTEDGAIVIDLGTDERPWLLWLCSGHDDVAAHFRETLTARLARSATARRGPEHP